MMKFFTAFITFAFSLNAFAEEVGTYIVNGVTFEIPKSALLIKQPEGVVDGVTILLKWPELTPAQWEGDQSQVIKVGIDKNVDRTGAIKGVSRPLDMTDTIYHNRAGWMKIIGDRQYALNDPNPINLGYFDSIDATYYKLQSKGKYASPIINWYIVGSPLEPERWYRCQVNCNTRCETVVALNNKIYIKISHRKSLFSVENNLAKIESNIKSKIQSYIQP